MKRLPLCIAIVICAVLQIGYIIPCLLLWMLGAYKPWDKINDALNEIIFNNK